MSLLFLLVRRRDRHKNKAMAEIPVIARTSAGGSGMGVKDWIVIVRRSGCL